MADTGYWFSAKEDLLLQKYVKIVEFFYRPLFYRSRKKANMDFDVDTRAPNPEWVSWTPLLRILCSSLSGCSHYYFPMR